MKPFLSQIVTRAEESFCIRRLSAADYQGHWHHHPELELHYVIRGEGVRFIGDSISNFRSEEMVLLGANLPHCWQFNSDNENEPGVESIALQFKPNCLGPAINNLPEAYQLPVLFEKAKRGVVINGQAKATLLALMHRMMSAQGLERIILLLSVLKALTENREQEAITLAEHRIFPSEDADIHRLNQICQYTLTHFRRNISLKEVAASSNLNQTSFCRYFKLVTKKNYFSFLIQVRVSQACRMLIDNRYTVNVICYDCGFNNLSNFYRHFKKVTGMTPSGYKQKYLNSYTRKVAS